MAFENIHKNENPNPEDMIRKISEAELFFRYERAKNRFTGAINYFYTIKNTSVGTEGIEREKILKISKQNVDEAENELSKVDKEMKRRGKSLE